MKRRSIVRTFDGGVGFTDVDTPPEGRQFIGTGLGLLIAGLAAGGASVASGVIASKAQDKATAAQSESATQAQKVAEDTLAENRRQFDVTQANNWAQYNASIKNNFEQYAYKQKQLAPYQGLGLSASNTLAQMLHLPIAKIAPPPTPQLPTPQMAPQMRQSVAPPNAQPPTPPDAPTFASMFGAHAAGGTPAPSTMQSAGGGMVMMRAPNGQTQSVPAAQVAHYQQAGATLANG